MVDLMLPPSSQAAAKAGVKHTIALTPRQLCDVELLMNGGFSPLTGFMNEATYNHVVENMELPGSGLMFGLPVVFDTDDESLMPGDKALLKDGDRDIAIVTFTDK